MKRLEAGRFAVLREADGELRMTMSELTLYLEGSEMVGKRGLTPAALTLKDLAPYRRG